MNYDFIKSYKENDVLRKSFNELATSTFGISFEEWYNRGYWTEKYVPFSFVFEDQVIANVSVNKTDLIIEGVKKRALQIGTVMTHPDYRNKGLSRELMNLVLNEYENQYDVMYLFANETVLDFYPKFGFNVMNEFQYIMDFRTSNKDGKLLKLDGTKEKDLEFIYQFSSKRQPVSKLFSTENTEELLMFYCLYVFSQDIYYLEDENVIILFKNEEDELHIFDIVSQREYNIENVLASLAQTQTKRVVFHYTPEYSEIQASSTRFHGSEVLFVKTPEELQLPERFKHPLTSQA